MALSEEDIQRFGRQVLLREVGGRGQSRWLETQVVVSGGSLAVEVAAGYLAAAGAQVVRTGSQWGADRPLSPPPVRQRFALAEVESPGLELPPQSVLLGASGPRQRAFVRLHERACRACLTRWLSAPKASVDPTEEVALGAAAALCLLRWALGEEPPLAGVFDGGVSTASTPPPCGCS